MWVPHSDRTKGLISLWAIHCSLFLLVFILGYSGVSEGFHSSRSIWAPVRLEAHHAYSKVARLETSGSMLLCRAELPLSRPRANAAAYLSSLRIIKTILDIISLECAAELLTEPNAYRCDLYVYPQSTLLAFILIPTYLVKFMELDIKLTRV